MLRFSCPSYNHVPEKFLPLKPVRNAASVRQGSEAKQGCIPDSLMDFYMNKIEGNEYRMGGGRRLTTSGKD